MIFFKNKKNLKLIIFLVVVVILLIPGLIFLFAHDSPFVGEFQDDQLVNGRYYYQKTKTISLSNIEHGLRNNTLKKAYSDKYFSEESVSEKWESLQTIYYNNGDYHNNNLRVQRRNKNGKLTFDRAFIEGNHFICSDCFDNSLVEEELAGEMPINQDVKDVFKNIKVTPWHGSSRLHVSGLYDLQLNHNFDARKKRFNILKYAFWDDIDFLGKVAWESKQVYAFRIIDKRFASVITMYFDLEKINYVGSEIIRKSYAGDDMVDVVSKQKMIVLEEVYSDTDSGVNSDGLFRESEGEVSQKLDRECTVDTDCDGIVGYTVEAGACSAQVRCTENQCALICLNPSLVGSGSCSKYNKEINAFINYTCQENKQGVSRLVNEKDSDRGICKVSNSDEKTIVFYKCIDDKEGKIELLEQIDDGLKNQKQQVFSQRAEAIQAYLLSQKQFSWQTIDDGQNACVFDNLGDEDDLFPLSVWAYCQEYKIENGKITELSGSSGPVLIDYPNVFSFYRIDKFSHQVPRNGTLYYEDIQNIFPKDLQNKIYVYSGQNKLQDALKKKVLSQIDK